MALRNLDTRGFMDGAMAGYNMVDQVHSRKEAKERQNRLDERDEQRYQDELNHRKKTEDESNRRLDADFELRKAEKEEQSRLRQLQTESAQSQQDALDYSTKRQMMMDFQADNLHLLQEGTQLWAETGQLHDIFEHEYIKGTRFDPTTRNLADLNRSKNYAGMFGQVISGNLDLNSPEFLTATTDYVGESINRNIGQVDPQTGQAIVNSEIGQISIMPNQEGRDSMAVMLNVTYEDGSTSQKPLTHNRSSDPDDDVLLIPIDMFAQSIFDDVKQARYIASSKTFSDLYQQDNGALRQSLLTLEEERAKALADPYVTEEQLTQINSSFDEQAERIRILYHNDSEQEKSLDADFQLAHEWAANGLDLQKMEWIKGLKQMALGDPELRAQLTRLMSEGDVMARLDTAYQEVLNGTPMTESLADEPPPSNQQSLRAIDSAGGRFTMSAL